MVVSAPGQREAFSSDDDRWRAVVKRDPAARGAFVYSVRTTGVYCRPGCAARLPLHRNVRFHDTCVAAEAAGFRPCRRCQPHRSSPVEDQSLLVARACRMIEDSVEPLSLEELARSLGMSRVHFHRVVKAQTGITPKAYAAACRSQRAHQHLRKSPTITTAMFATGFQSTGRFYAETNRVLGMTPTTFRAGGAGTQIHFAIGECWLGSILVAASLTGVCAILIGDDPEQLAHDLQDRFPKAELIGGDAGFEQLVARVVGFLETPSAGLGLPLDIRGTAFQQRVWQALQEIPAGSTVTYTEIAQRIGAPNAVRAVAGACAANPLAVAIPCHRVVRTDGSLSGYRWGVERKRALLARES